MTIVVAESLIRGKYTAHVNVGLTHSFCDGTAFFVIDPNDCIDRVPSRRLWKPS
jgi:hypothetical protein